MARVYKCAPNAKAENNSYRIVPIRDEDKYLIMQWRNEQIDILRQKEPLTREQQERYFKNVVDKLFESAKPDQLLFSFLDNDKIVGYGGLVHIDWESGNGEISFLTETSRNNSPDQIRRDWSTYLGLLKQVTQSQLKFTKIYTYAYDVRPVLFEVLLANNFREEARLLNHVRVAGTLCDVLIHSYFFDDVQMRIAREDDMTTYFNWANDEGVRQHSFNQEPITLENHTKWFSRKLSSEKTRMFVAEINSIAIGQIRFDETSEGIYEIGFSLDAHYRGRNLGSKVLDAGIQALLRVKSNARTIIGKVKITNSASMKSFVSLGFARSAESDGVVTYTLNPMR